MSPYISLRRNALIQAAISIFSAGLQLGRHDYWWATLFVALAVAVIVGSRRSAGCGHPEPI